MVLHLCDTLRYLDTTSPLILWFVDNLLLERMEPKILCLVVSHTCRDFSCQDGLILDVIPLDKLPDTLGVKINCRGDPVSEGAVAKVRVV